MHIAEGILPLGHALFWGAAASPFVLLGLRRPRAAETSGGRSEQSALDGMGAALLFAVTLFPLPVPFTGATSHLCATPLLALLLGPGRVTVASVLVLAVQALFFAHGGLTTLGANVFTLGVVGPWTAVGLMHLARRSRLPGTLAVGLACGLADLVVYLVDAGVIALGVAAPGEFGTWFVRILAGFAPIQAPLAVLEGVASALLLRTLVHRRPALRIGRPLLPALALCLAFLSAAPAQAELTGLDEAVLERTAAEAGHPASEPWLDLEGGELGRALLAAAFFTAGAICGRRWERLFPPRRNPK